MVPQFSSPQFGPYLGKLFKKFTTGDTFQILHNGGHGQYFSNIENNGDLNADMTILTTVLSEKLVDNLHKAYKAHLILEENEDDEKAEEIIEACDNVFYENEEEINSKLEAYADKIQL